MCRDRSIIRKHILALRTQTRPIIFGTFVHLGFHLGEAGVEDTIIPTIIIPLVYVYVCV